MSTTNHKGKWGYSYYYERCDSGDDRDYCLKCATEEYVASGSLGDCCSTYRTNTITDPKFLPICSFCKASVTPYWTCCLKDDINIVECVLSVNQKKEE